MSSRLDTSSGILASLSTPSMNRSAETVIRPDGALGFKESRRDPQDMGTWAPTPCYCAQESGSERDAVASHRRGNSAARSWIITQTRVHVASFTMRVGLDKGQIIMLASGSAGDACLRCGAQSAIGLPEDLGLIVR
jgi:hypothetical protein